MLISDEMRLIVPAEHKWGKKKSIGIKMLLVEPFIVRERGSGTLKSIELKLNEAGYGIDDLNISAQMESTEAVKQGIINNAGVPILSTIAVERDIKEGVLKALEIEGLNLKRIFILRETGREAFLPYAMLSSLIYKTNLENMAVL
jgi:DNA-binding transcriptional LysR family regulator